MHAKCHGTQEAEGSREAEQWLPGLNLKDIRKDEGAAYPRQEQYELSHLGSKKTKLPV